MPGKDGNPIAVGKIRLDVPKLAELTTRVQSPVVSIANLPWYVFVQPRFLNDTSTFVGLSAFVSCNEADQRPNWSCEASVILNLLSPKVGQNSHSRDLPLHTFCTKEPDWGYPCFMARKRALDPENGFLREEDGGVVFEAEITVTKVIGAPVSTLCDFTAPQPNLTDVALIIDGKPLHVSKTYLAFHSPVFHSMFFSDFAEKEMKEIPLEDVKYDEFVELLYVIFPSRKPITVATVESLLRLADQFNMQVVLHSCEEFLRGPDSLEIPLAKKLLWSDQYRLASLQPVCLKSLKSLLEVKALKATKEFGEFSGRLKEELAERMLELC